MTHFLFFCYKSFFERVRENFFCKKKFSRKYPVNIP